MEVEGQRNPVAVVRVPGGRGHEGHDLLPLLRRLRRDVVELILDNHPQDCQTCERNGNCELQKLAYELGVRDAAVPGRAQALPEGPIVAACSRDPEKCILCGRCVRVCAEVQGVNNLSQQQRGFHNVVGARARRQHDRLGLHPLRPVRQRLPHGGDRRARQPPTPVLRALADPDKHVVVQTAPSIRAADRRGLRLRARHAGDRQDGHRAAG